jgi:hypothetical protein
VLTHSGDSLAVRVKMTTRKSFSFFTDALRSAEDNSPQVWKCSKKLSAVFSVHCACGIQVKVLSHAKSLACRIATSIQNSRILSSANS